MVNINDSGTAQIAGTGFSEHLALLIVWVNLHLRSLHTRLRDFTSILTNFLVLRRSHSSVVSYHPGYPRNRLWLELSFRRRCMVSFWLPPVYQCIDHWSFVAALLLLIPEDHDQLVLACASCCSSPFVVHRAVATDTLQFPALIRISTSF